MEYYDQQRLVATYYYALQCVCMCIYKHAHAWMDANDYM